MKRFAVKGLIALLAAVALCMFFSGTIKTITTAKVKIVTAKTGKLEEQIRLTGTLVFPQTREIGLDGLDSDQSAVIRRVCVAKGRRIKSGDILFEAEVAGLQGALDELSETCASAQKELLELTRKNGELRLKRTEELWLQAYDALTDAQERQLEAGTTLRTAARLAGVPLEDGRLPENVRDEALLKSQQAADEADAAVAEAEKRFASANRLGISEDVVSTITKTRELERKIADAQERMAELNALREQAKAVCAPEDGYVLEINVKAGDSFGGQSAAMLLSAGGTKGVLRADVSSLTRRIEKGTQVTIGEEGAKTVTKKVTATGVDEEGKAYIDIELTDKEITTLGGAASLMASPIAMTASYRAQSATTLLPVSAVRGTGDSRYVYVVTTQQNALGEQTMKVSRQDVKVLAEVGATASLETDLSRQRIAYMEDREISDGSEVMAYAE